jgi:glycosyltransferase involved in cell wall biosynthesis
MRPVVSIIVPTFNRLHFLRAAVESVFAQTFSDWELILADDGSDSETVEYMHQLQQQQPRVRLLRLPHRGNLSAVRNAGLREASGEYIAFLDSDDLWVPTKLETQVASLRANSDRKWSYTGFRMVDAALNRLPRAPQFSAANGWIIDALMNAQTTIMQPSVVVRRDFFDEVGPYDESIRLCGDYELAARFALHGAADCIDQPLVMIRRHTEHCCDDVSACQDVIVALKKIRQYATGSHTQAIVRKRLAIACAYLARSQAVHGFKLSALATMLASAHYSWRYSEWWSITAEATTRALVPTPVQNVLRRARHALRLRHS